MWRQDAASRIASICILVFYLWVGQVSRNEIRFIMFVMLNYAWLCARINYARFWISLHWTTFLHDDYLCSGLVTFVYQPFQNLSLSFDFNVKYKSIWILNLQFLVDIYQTEFSWLFVVSGYVSLDLNIKIKSEKRICFFGMANIRILLNPNTSRRI